MKMKKRQTTNMKSQRKVELKEKTMKVEEQEEKEINQVMQVKLEA